MPVLPSAGGNSRGPVLALPRPLRKVEAGREASSEAESQRRHSALKALVVDDDSDVLDAAVALFRTMGFEVLPATNGQEAIELAKRHRDLDVLFSDVLMPGVDGVSAAREAKKLVPELKVILVSGFPAAALANAADMDFDFLLKPYSRSQVARLLRS